VGLWLSASARRSGEELARDRVEESLKSLIDAVGKRWMVERSRLLDIADSRPLQLALEMERQVDEIGDSTTLRQLDGLWRLATPTAAAVTLRDRAGKTIAHLPADLTVAEPRMPGELAAAVLYRTDIHARFSGERVGSMEVVVQVKDLLPTGSPGLGIGGAVFALFDTRTGDPVLPLSIDRDLLSRERFTWHGEDWLTARHHMTEPPLLFVLAGPVGPMTQAFGAAARRGTVALVLVAFAVVSLVTLFSRRLTQSMESLAQSATDVSAGDLSRRVEESGPPEVQGTARAFNAMTDSLNRTLQRLSQQEAVTAVGEFAASLAHEVRNPLTSIRVDLQRSRRKLDVDSENAVQLVDRALEEIDRLNDSVGNFLRIARSGRVRLARVDVRTALEAAVRAAAPRFEAIGAELEYDAPLEPVCVAVDQSAIEQLVLNLLLNAADVLRRGQKAKLQVDPRRNEVAISVSDEGPGVRKEDANRVFEPFFTTKKDGTGLGLSVARRIALAHGSELEITRARCGGALFRFVLPLERDASSRPESSSMAHRSAP
jgi:signal transduction histidine kinase